MVPALAGRACCGCCDQCSRGQFVDRQNGQDCKSNKNKRPRGIAAIFGQDDGHGGKQNHRQCGHVAELKSAPATIIEQRVVLRSSVEQSDRIVVQRIQGPQRGIVHPVRLNNRQY